MGGVSYLEYVPASETVRFAGAPPKGDSMVYCFLFAWYAQHPAESRLAPP